MVFLLQKRQEKINIFIGKRGDIITCSNWYESERVETTARPKKKMIELRTKLSVERCTRGDINPDWFRNLKTKEDTQLVLGWINLKDSLLKVYNDIDGISTHLVKIKEAHTNILKSAFENTKH